MKSAAIISEAFVHHLDHLAPICHFIDCPLIVDDRHTYSLAKKFYPQVNTSLQEPIDLKKIAQEYDLLFLSTKHAAIELYQTFQMLFNKKMRFCFCPHGQSDKGYLISSLDPFENQDIALVYGDLMLSRLQKRNHKLNEILTIGNYRYSFYKKFQNFYDKALPITKAKKTYLYAPTWDDQENVSSFFSKGKKLAASLPHDCHLIIKLHPFLEKYYPAEVYAFIGQFSSEKIIIFFDHPLVYPFLEKTDVYIGDFSSIGYDFLTFDRPMFFFNPQNTNVKLLTCGITIPESTENIFTFIEENLDQSQFSEQRKLLNREAFMPNIDPKIVLRKRFSSNYSAIS